MKYKLILAVLIVFLVFGLTAIVRLNQNSSSIIQENNSGLDILVEPQGSQNPDTGNNGGPSLVSLQILSEHNSKSDCWVAYDGKVYDITSWLPVHPGGAYAISPYCGTSSQFQQAFTNQHGKSQVKRLMSVGVLIGDFDIKGNLA